MKRIVSILIGFLILFDLFLLVCGKIHPIGKIFLNKENDYTLGGQRYADLYRFSKVDVFREEINYGVPIERNDSLNKASMYTIGDSFFGVIGQDDFTQVLRNRTGLKITNITNLDVDMLWYPLVFFKNHNIDITKKKILILESAERYSLARAPSYPNEVLDFSAKYSSMKDSWENILTYRDLNFFFNNNVILERFNELKASFLFNYTGEISKEIAAFSLNPNMLFYKEEVDFNKQPKSDAQIEDAANNIYTTAKIFENKYNIKLIYIIIPNKYSIYNDYVNGKNEYDGFIPSLCSKLDKKGVLNIDLYSEYMKYRNENGREWLYYKSDTHFTPFGREFLLSKCMELINSDLTR